MSKPEDIPQDAWEAAAAVVGRSDGLGYAKVYTERIARVIMADRERGATYIERRPGLITHRQHLADAIRRGDAYDEHGLFVAGVREE